MRVTFVILTVSLLFLGCNKTESKSTEQESPNTEAANANSEEPEEEAPTANSEESAESTEATPETPNEESAEANEEESAEAVATNTVQPGPATPEQQAAEAGCAYKQAIANAEAADGEAPAVLPACAQEVDSTPTSTEGDISHFGSDFTLTETQAIDSVISKADELSGQNVRVQATISKVCLRKGCWFVLQGTENSERYVRVTMRDYSFFVPTDCSGKEAVVEGVFRAVELPEAARQHLAEDGGEDPNSVQGSAVELTLIATAVDIKG